MNVFGVTLCGIFLFMLVALSYQADQECEVPQEPAFKAFNEKHVAKFDWEKYNTGLGKNKDVHAILTQLNETEGKDPNESEAAVGPTDLTWQPLCPVKFQSVFLWGVKYGKKVCWVIQPVWYAVCPQRVCLYTQIFQNYHVCRPRYIYKYIWAFCPGKLGFKLIPVRMPRDCDCVRYFCKEDAIPIPEKPQLPEVTPGPS